MRAGFRGLSGCMVILAALAGTVACATPVAQKITPVVVPAGDPSEWISSNDYPVKALFDMVEGVTAVSLAIDPAGFVSGCSVTASSGSSLLDQTTCALLVARARFQPAAMNGASRHWTKTIRWQVPRQPPVDLRPVAFSLQYDVDENGRPVTCVGEGTLPDGQPAGATCADLLKRMTFRPATGVGGVSVRRRVLQTFAVQITDLPSPPRATPPAN